MTDYPASVKNFLALQDGIDGIVAQHPNERGDEITAIQTLIGPMGSDQSYQENIKNLLIDLKTGCKLTSNANDSVEIQAGSVAIPDSGGNVRWRRNTSALTVNWDDIDTGAEANSTRYYVFIVADSVGTTFTGKISLSPTAPTGLTYFRLIGSFFNDSGGDIEDVIDDEVQSTRETGVISFYGKVLHPSGSLLCDGAAYDATADVTLQPLFDEIGNLFGGSDNTDFQVPDLRGRSLIGLDNLGGSSANRVTATEADTIGGSSGSEYVTLTTGQMPVHAHGLSAVAAGGSGVSGSGGINSGATSFSTDNAGNDEAHNNMMPWMAFTVFIWK